MRRLLLYQLIAVLLLLSDAMAQQIRIRIGTAGGIDLPIGQEVLIPIQVSASEAMEDICFIDIPISSDNQIVTERLGGTFTGSPIEDWTDRSFLEPPYNNNPQYGWTCQTLLAFEDLLLEPLTPWNPYPGGTIAFMRVRIANDPNLIGQTRNDFFMEGLDPQGLDAYFGDCQGMDEYDPPAFIVYPFTFVGCAGTYNVGTGYGVMNNYHDHIDTYCSQTDNFYFYLGDVTRRQYTNPHGHNGMMPIGQNIVTYTYDGTFPGRLTTDIDNNWISSNQASAVDAHTFVAFTYDYWLSQYNQNSYNNAGSSLFSSVEFSLFYDDAKYDYDNHVVVYGIPSSGRRSMAGCLEIVTHEWTHGVTRSISDLGLDREAGALNESFSNMMGVTVRWVYNGRPQNMDWSLGLNWDAQTNIPYYRMDYTHGGANPVHLARPDFYNDSQDWYNLVGCTPTEFNDKCGVHANSGVPDKMFSLLASGGTSLHNGVTVQPIGIEEAMGILFEANKSHWNGPGSNTDTFMKAREGTIEAARGIPNYNRDWAIQAALAWNAVGVCDICNYVPGDANGNGIANGLDLIYINNFLKGLSQPPYTCDLDYDPQRIDFYVGAEYNGDCVVNGLDITYGIAYFRGFEPDIKWCPHFTPSIP